MTAVGHSGALRGFVLCGGKSRRMGRDKASIEIDGRPMAARIAGALRDAGAETVVTVGGAVEVADADGRLADRWPGQGPLGAIATALATLGPDDEAVVVSCDLVAPDATAIAAVVEARRRTDADIAVPVLEGRHQWLHAAWHGRVAGIVNDVFEAGERSVAGGVHGLRLVVVSGLAPAALRDADEPDDLPD